jgi:hypothetical protein
MSKWRRLQQPAVDFRYSMSESHLCVDCGLDTHPGNLNRAEAEQEAARQIRRGKRNWKIPAHSGKDEIYYVHDHVWKAAGMTGWGGCLCVGCLEKRIGRELRPEDFDPDHRSTPSVRVRRG